jgi:hypothetical protein
VGIQSNRGPASFTSNLEGRFEVAKKEERGNREKRKPKADKPKPSAQVLPFTPVQGLGNVKRGARKKGS